MKIIAEQNHPTDEEIIIHEVLIDIGESVSPNQTLFIAEGSKSLFDIESSESGKIKEILVKAGDVVPIGSVLVILE
jgi:pyruvate/2-oxoglutarate dehydrogenase complex dihydrolipoamide acyltransferase (E2) component